MNLNDVFGSHPTHTWPKLRSILIGNLRRKFTNASDEQLEDAASDAVLALCDYWVGLPSSVSPDTDRNWNYAKWYATRKSAALLYKEMHLANETDSLDREIATSNNGSLNGHDVITLKDLIADTAEQADLTDEEYQERVRTFIAAIPEGELEQWLTAVVDGESVRATAARTGVGYVTVHRRRVSGKKRLSGLAHQFGLRVAS